MSISRVRYCGGDTLKVACKPDPNYPFCKGDLLFQFDTNFAQTVPNVPALVDGSVYPATVILPSATEAELQLAFARNFAGVADEDYGFAPAAGLYDGRKNFNLSQLGSQRSVSVCTAGRFEFDCPSLNWKNGDAVGIYGVGGGTGIPDAQTVDKLAGGATLSQLIGVVAQQEAPIENSTQNTPQLRVVVDIRVPKPYATAPVAGTYTGTSGQ
jgi:hypothetical protein